MNIKINIFIHPEMVVAWFMRSIGGVLTQSSGFSYSSVHLGITVDIVTMGQVFLPVRRFDHVSILPPMIHPR